MRRLLGLAVGAALAGLAGGAQAADLISYPTSTSKALPVSSAATTYDWNGFYAGVFGVGQRSAAGGDQYGIGIDAGVNTTFNFALVGAEVAVEGLQGGSGPTAYVEGLGRAGVLLTDNTLLYGAVGYGADTTAPGGGDVLAGGGLEFAVNDALSLRAQYLHGFPVSGTDAKDQITLGAQYHF